MELISKTYKELIQPIAKKQVTQLKNGQSISTDIYKVYKRTTGT